MGQKHSLSKEHFKSKSLAISTLPQTLSPQNIISNLKKPNLMEKIKSILSKKKNRSFLSVHIPNNPFARKSNPKTPLRKTKGMLGSPLKPGISFTSHVSDIDIDIDETKQMKKRLNLKMNTRDYDLNNPNLRSGRHNHRLSLFDNIGISPTSPNKNNYQSFDGEFSINNPNINIFPHKRKKNNGDKNDSPPTLNHRNRGRSSQMHKKLEFSIGFPNESPEKTLQEEKGKICQFISPLIRDTKTNKKPQSDLGALLVSNYTSYLRRMKKKQENRESDSHIFLSKKKAMKQMLNVDENF